MAKTLTDEAAKLLEEAAKLGANAFERALNLMQPMLAKAILAKESAVELAAVRHDLAHAEKYLAEIDDKAQEAAERKARKDGGGRAKRAKGDMPRILAGARRDRSEDSGGKTAQMAERRRAEAIDALDAARRASKSFNRSP